MDRAAIENGSKNPKHMSLIWTVHHFQPVWLTLSFSQKQPRRVPESNPASYNLLNADLNKNCHEPDYIPLKAIL